jgi:hypothetical protein
MRDVASASPDPLTSDLVPPGKHQGWVVCAVGLIYVLGVLFQARGFNGPWYWNWEWRSLDLVRASLNFGLPLILVLLARASAEDGSATRRPWIPVGLLVGAHFLAQIIGTLLEGALGTTVSEIVQSANATSYYSDAQDIRSLKPWLAGFHEASLRLHSSTHPPGPILYYYALLRLAGSAASLVGGCLVGLLASAGVAAIYAFSGLWTSDRRTRITVAAVYALAPATILFFPELDQVYPLFAMGLLASWVKALDDDGRWALAFGALLWLSSFVAYQLVTLGAFVAPYGVYALARDWRDRSRRWRPVRAAAVALGVFFGLHLLLHVATGYRPVESFLHALQNQKRHSLDFERARPYLDCVLLDPYDFLIGAGMCALPLVVLYGARAFREFSVGRRDIVLSLLGLSTIVIVDVTGLLRAETARVWLFLQPLLLVPAGLALATLSRKERGAVVWVQWLTVVALKCRMWFIHT